MAYKLTFDQVDRIHELYNEKGTSIEELSKRFSVNESTIEGLVKGSKWPINYKKYHGQDPPEEVLQEVKKNKQPTNREIMDKLEELERLIKG